MPQSHNIPSLAWFGCSCDRTRCQLEKHNYSVHCLLRIESGTQSTVQLNRFVEVEIKVVQTRKPSWTKVTEKSNLPLFWIMEFTTSKLVARSPLHVSESTLDVLSIFVHNLFVDGRDVISFFYSDHITQFHKWSRECFKTEIRTMIIINTRYMCNIWKKKH